MLSSLGADMVRVLDLYAGTGSFGIEALSRGAEWVDFVERDPRHTAAIRRNLAALGMTNRGRVCRMSVERALDTLREGYGVVFMDPPYSDPEIGKILERLIASPVVARGTLIVVEHSRHQPLAEKYGNFVSIRERRYGETVVSIFQEESQIVK